ncbi:TfoX/Sxy family protein [Nitrospirillum iridis]|uniref:TfoX/Sxy family transcriptional regulator of competence genes n=1 Tax=Nitrospirillum iridis TaxID=765888 RepID=A0A7X0EBR2_9PROT|nr:TfoX/Sxy family protein [Nitrospirillum iridis]MBB6250365.1 TfoX/Sxy family transcriptional regulator of competence genes [Nitrospirillum iridis]
MAHDPKDLQAVMMAAVPDLELTFKPMFGGILAYAGGKPVASLSDVGLALKLAGSDQTTLLALPGAKPLQYGPDQPPSKTYVVVPDALLADAPALHNWTHKAAAAAAKVPARKSRKA